MQQVLQWSGLLAWPYPAVWAPPPLPLPPPPWHFTDCWQKGCAKKFIFQRGLEETIWPPLRGAGPLCTSECERLHGAVCVCGQERTESKCSGTRSMLSSSHPTLMPPCISGQIYRLRMKLNRVSWEQKKGPCPSSESKTNDALGAAWGIDDSPALAGHSYVSATTHMSFRELGYSVWGAGWEPFVAGILLGSSVFDPTNIPFFLFFFKRKEKIGPIRRADLFLLFYLFVFSVVYAVSQMSV